MLEARVYNFGSVGITTDFSGYEDFSGNKVDTTMLNRKPCNYLTFDGNGVDLLDNNLKFYEEGDYSGYTFTDYGGSTFVSDEDCFIADSRGGYNGFWIKSPFPENITIQFFENCCSKIKIYYVYATSGNVLKTQTVNVADEWATLNLEPEDCSRIEIYFTKTVVPNQCIRISSMFDGTVDRLTDFIQHSLLEEINILSDDLPINQFECSIANDVSEISKTPLGLYNNHKYYGEYYVRSVEQSGKNVYDIVAQNVLCLFEGVTLENWEYHALHGATTESILFYLETLTNSNVYINGNSVKYISGTHKDGSCRVALCELAYTLAKMVYSSRTYNNDIYLIDVPTKVTSVITNTDRRIIGEATYKKTSEFADAQRKRQFIGTLEMESDFDKTKSVSGNIDDIVTVSFDVPVGIYSITGATMLSSTLTSCKLILTATSVNIKYGELPTTDKITTIANLNTTNGEIKKYDTFLTYPYRGDDDSIIAAQNKNIQKYISSKGTVTAKIRLRNEKVGDLIQIETAWDGIITGIITKMTISFGYEDIADIEVVEWSI